LCIAALACSTKLVTGGGGLAAQLIEFVEDRSRATCYNPGMSKLRWPCVLLVGFSGSLLVGCGSADKAAQEPIGIHDPDDVPITEANVKMPANYSEAIARIGDYRDTVRDAIAAGTPAKAHRSLDELDIVLRKLPSIAKASGISNDHWEAINTTGKELRDLFNTVHSAIDEKREPDFNAVAEPIDQAIAKLQMQGN
jgi:hypothetical protein